MRAHECARRIAGVRPSRRTRLRLAPLAMLAVAATTAGVLAGAADADAATGAVLVRQGCAGTAAAPGARPRTVLRRAVRCAVNAERRARGLAPLRGSRRLAHAANAHAADMVAHRYFAHERAGWTLRGRLRAAGWNRDAAEAIGFGCGGLGTPAAVVQSWMASPPHRAILLSRIWRRAGIGLAVGSPLAMPCPEAGTWVLDAG
jgi:uncharacterized protein YkwD